MTSDVVSRLVCYQCVTPASVRRSSRDRVRALPFFAISRASSPNGARSRSVERTLSVLGRHFADGAPTQFPSFGPKEGGQMQSEIKIGQRFQFTTSSDNHSQER